MADRTKSFLKLDRRLIERREWIEPAELERELAALPDVADKIAPPRRQPRGVFRWSSGARELAKDLEGDLRAEGALWHPPRPLR